MASCAKEANFKKLIMGCVFFHGIIQERKKFGPLGWNNKYEFNDSDLQVSLEMVKMYLNESDKSSVCHGKPSTTCCRRFHTVVV